MAAPDKTSTPVVPVEPTRPNEEFLTLKDFPRKFRAIARSLSQARDCDHSLEVHAMADMLQASIDAAPSPVVSREPLTFEAFSRANRERCESPQGFNHQLSAWSTSDWITAVMGELGEAANVVKKLNRYRDGVPGNKLSESELRDQLRKELGDVFVYLDLIAQSLGFSIAEAAVEVFDAKSKEIGYTARAAARTCETSLTLPEHKCGLFLTHNEHRDYYEKLPEYLAERELEDTFESPEAMQRAIDTDEHWHLQWYPETPVGFFHVSAPTLEEVLKMAARTCETKEKP